MSKAKPVALVTGASSGIGAAFAPALRAARGHDLVLVARDDARLEALAKELENGVRHRRRGAHRRPDHGDGNSGRRGPARIGDPPIDLLVNNAAFGTVGKFAELPVEARSAGDPAQRLGGDALAPRRARADGRTRPRRRHQRVVAGADTSRRRRNATYGATKAFVTSFTQAVHEELKGTGVNVMVLCPGLHPHRVPGTGPASTRARCRASCGRRPTAVVAAALRAYDKGRAVCVPGSLNQAGAAFSSADAAPASPDASPAPSWAAWNDGAYRTALGAVQLRIRRGRCGRGRRLVDSTYSSPFWSWPNAVTLFP